MTAELKRILYVEDETDIQTIAVTVLEAIGGFSIVTCSSGKQAIEAASGANADLILLDVMMPEMDGPTTLKALRDIPETSGTPVIFMTAKVQAQEIEHLRSLGALDVIPKPFDPMTLPEQVRGIWRRWADARHTSGAQPPGTALASTEGEMQALLRGYAGQLPAKIAEIESLCRRLVSAADSSALKPLHRSLHSLAGSGGTFGFAELGNRARAMELALAPYLEDGEVPQAVLASLLPQIEALKEAAVAPRHQV